MIIQDDWREETKSRLSRSFIYNTFKLKCADNNEKAIALVDDAVSYAYQRSKTVIKHMGEFTLHDGDHLYRVLHLMERLLGDHNIKNLSSPELMLLILTAFFHDIGMAPDEEEVIAWRKVWDHNPVFSSPADEYTYEQFKRFYVARPDQQLAIDRLTAEGKNTAVDTIKGYLITEFIRQTHANRARDIIGKDWLGKITYKDTDLTVDFAQLCHSHNEEPLKLLQLDNNRLCGGGEIACLPLVGVILRLADILDFDAKRTPAILYSHLYVRDPISIREWNKHRAVEAWVINPELIQYSAKCTHPVIESSIHSFCDDIDQELGACKNIVTTQRGFNESNSRDLDIKFPFRVNRDKIETQKDLYNKPIYIYRDTRFNLSKKQVIELLMGTKLYGNPEVALRELVQNSIDACLLRRAQEAEWGNLYMPKIEVKYYLDGTNYTLEVTDNGTGMDQYIIDTYYSKVGSSFYKSTDFYDLKSRSNANFTPTSRFGIGILSCFMVADTLTVDTRRVYGPHESSEALSVTVEGQDSIFWIRSGTRSTPGTTTKLTLRQDGNPWASMDGSAFIKSVENVVPNPPFQIAVSAQSQIKEMDENSFKSVSVNDLKDHSWSYNDNIRYIDVKFDRVDLGIVGSAVIAILESHSEPIVEINLNSKNITIEGNNYVLNKRLTYADNAIAALSDSVSVNDGGGINAYTYSNNSAISRSKISLHGIDVPTTIFPESWLVKNNQARILWPFPFVIVADICGNRDLDLNSPRTEIMASDKWMDFEKQLAALILSEVRNKVSEDYWNKLRSIFFMRMSSQNFLNALNAMN